MYKQYCSFYDLSDINSADSFLFQKLGDGTNLAIDGLKNDCGVLIGVPGVVEDVGCLA
jgi:hypothetical protein